MNIEVIGEEYHHSCIFCDKNNKSNLLFFNKNIEQEYFCWFCNEKYTVKLLKDIYYISTDQFSVVVPYNKKFISLEAKNQIIKIPYSNLEFNPKIKLIDKFKIYLTFL
jgi:uncharacterized CHY-type Zn-finger protein